MPNPPMTQAGYTHTHRHVQIQYRYIHNTSMRTNTHMNTDGPVHTTYTQYCMMMSGYVLAAGSY